MTRSPFFSCRSAGMKRSCGAGEPWRPPRATRLCTTVPGACLPWHWSGPTGCQRHWPCSSSCRDRASSWLLSIWTRSSCAGPPACGRVTRNWPSRTCRTPAARLRGGSSARYRGRVPYLPRLCGVPAGCLGRRAGPRRAFRVPGARRRLRYFVRPRPPLCHPGTDRPGGLRAGRPPHRGCSRCGGSAGRGVGGHGYRRGGPCPGPRGPGRRPACGGQGARGVEGQMVRDHRPARLAFAGGRGPRRAGPARACR